MAPAETVLHLFGSSRADGIAPFTVLSCDNLQGNGDVARQAVTSFARLVDPELARWMRELHEASAAAADIMKAGGNAVEAMVADPRPSKRYRIYARSNA